MKKVLKITLITLLSVVILVVAVVIIAVVAILLKPAERTTGVYQEKGGDVLYIADSSLQKSWNELIFLDNNDVLTVADEENERIFKPLKQGSAIIADDEYFCGEYLGSTLYEVNVDENLSISYEERYVCYLLSYYEDFYICETVTVKKPENITTLSNINVKKISEEFERVYGVVTKRSETDTTGMTKLNLNYQNSTGYSFNCEYYISEEKIFYRLGYSADPTQWYEFTPDKCCNLGKINELLNEFLTN